MLCDRSNLVAMNNVLGQGSCVLLNEMMYFVVLRLKSCCQYYKFQRFCIPTDKNHGIIYHYYLKQLSMNDSLKFNSMFC